MSALLSFLPTMRDPSETLLAVEAVRQFYNPILAAPTFDTKLTNNMSCIAPVLFPHMITALHLSFHYCPTTGGLLRLHAPLIGALNTLLQHESGTKHFAETSALTEHIGVLIQLWISISPSTTCNRAISDLVNIIDTLFTYVPTREALKYVLGTTQRSRFCGGLRRLLVTSSLLQTTETSTIDLPTSLTTNMCGLGILGRARPSLRRLFIHYGAIDALCAVLRRVVIEDPNVTHPLIRCGPAYDHVLAICKELSILLGCEVSSSRAIGRALGCGLLEIIAHAVSVFGLYILTPYGRMPSILRYISSWCLKSRRIAIRVHDELAGLEDNTTLWQSLPSLPSPNELTVAFHEFLDTIGRTVVVSPENAKIIVPCMNSKVRRVC